MSNVNSMPNLLTYKLKQNLICIEYFKIYNLLIGLFLNFEVLIWGLFSIQKNFYLKFTLLSCLNFIIWTFTIK